MIEYKDLESDVDSMYQETVDWIRNCHAALRFQHKNPPVSPAEHRIVAPGGPFEIAPSGRSLEGPTGTLGPKCALGPASFSVPLEFIPQGELVYISDEFSCVPTPDIDRNVVTGLLHNSSTKPLMYSVDIYRSMKDGEYVAVCSYPIKDNTKTGKMVKPYAVGKTIKEAEEKLANSIRGFSGRKELGVINVHYEINRWLCVHCDNGTAYTTKQLLMEHLTNKHNTGVEKYTNPTNSDTFLILPLKVGI